MNNVDKFIFAAIACMILLVISLPLAYEKGVRDAETTLEISCDGVSLLGNTTVTDCLLDESYNNLTREQREGQECHNKITNESGCFLSYGCGDALVSRGEEQ